MKLATEQFTHTIDPDDDRQMPSRADAQRMHAAQVRGRLLASAKRLPSA